MYVAVPTVVSQSGLVGVPSVAVGSLPGADGLLLLLNAIALFGVSLLVIMGFLYVLVVRRGGQ